MTAVKFNRQAFLAILQRSGYPSNADFARRVGISPGALHDITVSNDGKPPRRHPSDELIVKLAKELKVPVTALIHDAEFDAVA